MDTQNVCPRFKVGDKVWKDCKLWVVKSLTEERVYMIESCNGTVVNLAMESDLSQYEGSKFHYYQRVKYNGQPAIVLKDNQDGTYMVQVFGGYCWTNCDESELEAYSSYPLRVAVDYKAIGYPKLNLCRILESHIGETFYSQIWGDVVLEGICLENNNGSQPLLRIRVLAAEHHFRNLTADGYLSYGERFGNIVLWPSKESYVTYHDYPLTAWMKWYGEHQPKRWRAEKGEYFYYIVGNGETSYRVDNHDDESDAYYRGYNYFQTVEEANKALDAMNGFFKKHWEEKGEIEYGG